MTTEPPFTVDTASPVINGQAAVVPQKFQPSRVTLFIHGHYYARGDVEGLTTIMKLHGNTFLPANQD